MSTNEEKDKSNMYEDAVELPFGNVFIGCGFDCTYCKPSFKAQMKRRMPHFNDQGKQINGCQDCYDYKPHWHEDRYQKYLTTKKQMPVTTGDQFIWLSRFGDIKFAKKEWIDKLIYLAKVWKDRTFLLQSKDPTVFYPYSGGGIPDNIIIGTTYETNRIMNYTNISQKYSNYSKAPDPMIRINQFMNYPHKWKMVTMEPLLKFDKEMVVADLKLVKPERVYVGYNSKRKGKHAVKLPEPTLAETMELVEELKKFTKVKLKHIPETL